MIYAKKSEIFKMDSPIGEPDVKFYDDDYYIERLTKYDIVLWFGINTNWKLENDIWYKLEDNDFVPCEKPIYEKMYEQLIFCNMENVTIILKGFIKFDYSDDFRTIKLIDDNKEIDLVKKFRAIFDLYDEQPVSISYFISDVKKTHEEILEGWLSKLYGGIVADYETNNYNYSECTWGTDYNTYLKIGGHDLFDEFSEYVGKYCILKININENEYEFGM